MERRREFFPKEIKWTNQVSIWLFLYNENTHKHNVRYTHSHNRKRQNLAEKSSKLGSNCKRVSEQIGEMTRLSEERKRIPASLAVFPFLVNWILSWRFGEEEEEEAVNFINFKLFTTYHQKRRRSITWKIRKKKRKFNRLMKADLPLFRVPTFSVPVLVVGKTPAEEVKRRR